MRIESSVTAISWIPSEAIRGMTKLPMEMGICHYDEPPPDVLGDLEEMRDAGAFRFANELIGWIEVEDGRIVDFGHRGRSYVGVTRFGVQKLELAVPGVAFPMLQPEPVVGDGSVRFVQTAGGRTGVPLPRRVNSPPFVKIASPSAWTTLELTIGTDGSSEHGVVGASPFPRHWIYDDTRRLVAKTGLIDFKNWYRHAFGSHSPWGSKETPALVTPAETPLERELSLSVMRRDPSLRKLRATELLVKQGDPGTELFLLLDGVLEVEVDGRVVTLVGPGAILGERALVEGGARTSTLRAVSPARVAVFSAGEVGEDALAAVAQGHRREVAPG
jgi:hypothetical protein